jgi:hypothetical protein
MLKYFNNQLGCTNEGRERSASHSVRSSSRLRLSQIDDLSPTLSFLVRPEDTSPTQQCSSAFHVVTTCDNDKKKELNLRSTIVTAKEQGEVSRQGRRGKKIPKSYSSEHNVN